MKNSYSLLTPVVLVIVGTLSLFSALRGHAQETPKPVAAQLTEAQWKAVEGIYQSSREKDRYLQFKAREHMLVAKLLWNDAEIQMRPDSPLEFTGTGSGDASLHVSFSTDSTGAVNQVNAANEIWKRTNDYKAPPQKIEMAHTPEQLKPFEGLYQLRNANSRFIQFKVKGTNLVLKQHWDGSEIHFVPETELDFFSYVVPQFSLHFTKDADGAITQVLAFKRDVWLKTQKSHPTTAHLKAFEGKYQLKDDPDNTIQLIARGSDLVVRQLWDGKEIALEPLTDTYFYNDAQSYPLQIMKDSEGAVNQVLVLGVDLFNKVK